MTLTLVYCTLILLTRELQFTDPCLSAAGPNAPHALLQQATCILLAVVAALSLDSAAGGAGRPPAKVADLLRASELQEHLNKGELLVQYALDM